MSSTNDYEFAHIHNYKAHKQIAKRNSLEKTTDDSEDNECHEGKALQALPATKEIKFDLSIPSYVLVYDLVYELENNFKSPYLEPHRKPPKQA
ncbi:hypothetical protein CIK05_15430 [Bdellovibrio sp. qaytius]|nr:hypothetical protein CIK05_15430 [Bdellovibrio sp. qaytius]